MASQSFRRVSDEGDRKRHFRGPGSLVSPAICTILLAAAASFPACGAAVAQPAAQSADRPIDTATRNFVIDALLKQLHRIYVFPDVARRMDQAIRARQAKREYDSITDGEAFANALTDHLRQVRDDSHLHVAYFPGGIPYDSEQPPEPAEIEKFREAGRLRNYEYRKVERLDGSVGLLQIDGFYPDEWTRDTIMAAMSFLANSEAIILDLRQNHGGAGSMLLTSYFFEDSIHLSDEYNRAENTTRQFWTYPIVPGRKLAGKDLYILTSRETVSAPEALANDMQSLKRAVVVGERTPGGANPTTIFRISDHFSAGIPFARMIRPGAASDNDGSVKPDVEVPADQALLTAHLMALAKAAERHRDDPQLLESIRQTIAQKEKELATVKTTRTPAASAP